MRSNPRGSRNLRLGVAVLMVGLVGCRSDAPSTDPLRLIDLGTDAVFEGSPAPVEDMAHDADWSFGDGPGDWFAPFGIEGFGVEGGAMVGRTSMPDGDVGPAPALVVPLPELPEDDLWSVEVRARVSAGANFTARFGQGDELILPAVFGNPMGIFRTPLQAGDEMHDYVIRPSNRMVVGTGPGHLVLTPSDVADAEFAIERVRLVLRKEHLQSVPSGPGWHGLSEVYQETIVSRSPERIAFDVTLPADPFLELSVGTIEDGDATFRVEVEPEGEAARTWEQTVSAAGAWQAGRLALDGLAGKPAQIRLALDGPSEGFLGFWGAPAVRSGAATRAADAGPQGVILVITDTLRRDHLQSYGYERATSPVMARMADEGVLFADPISQATWTKVSVPAIQTGLYPMTHTVKGLPDRLPASAQTMAESFREAGYATFGLLSIPFVGAMTNLHQGYEVLHEPGAMGDAGDLEDGGTVKSSFNLVPKLNDWLGERGDSKFFALLHIADAHSPFRPTAEYELTFAAEGEMDLLDEYTEQVRPHIEHPLMQRFGMPKREELAKADVDAADFVRIETNGLDGSIKGMDDQLGTLFARLDELGLRDKVVVALVADHGTELLEHDWHFHGHTMYGELNRVPMMLWGPGFVPSGVTIEPTVQTIDLMPTVLDVSGLPIPDGIQGRSTRALWEDPEGTAWRRPAITEMPLDVRSPFVGWSLVSEGWKLVQMGAFGEERSYELYDHATDPINLTDVSGDHPEVVERLSKMLEGWHAQALAARLDDAAAAASLDSEELERLRSLGYVQ